MRLPMPYLPSCHAGHDVSASDDIKHLCCAACTIRGLCKDIGYACECFIVTFFPSSDTKTLVQADSSESGQRRSEYKTSQPVLVLTLIRMAAGRCIPSSNFQTSQYPYLLLQRTSRLVSSPHSQRFHENFPGPTHMA